MILACSLCLEPWDSIAFVLWWSLEFMYQEIHHLRNWKATDLEFSFYLFFFLSFFFWLIFMGHVVIKNNDCQHRPWYELRNLLLTTYCSDPRSRNTPILVRGAYVCEPRSEYSWVTSRRSNFPSTFRRFSVNFRIAEMTLNGHINPYLSIPLSCSEIWFMCGPIARWSYGLLAIQNYWTRKAYFLYVHF